VKIESIAADYSVANHPGPEPCEGSRKAVLEALDRGICRLGIELRYIQEKKGG